MTQPLYLYSIDDSELVDSDDSNFENDSKEGVDNLSTKRLSVCVFSGNPRTASLFTTETLRRMGKGIFDYQVSSNKCPNKAPQVRMHFQKYLVDLNPMARQNLADQTDALIVMGDEYCKCPPEVCAIATAR